MFHSYNLVTVNDEQLILLDKIKRICQEVKEATEKLRDCVYVEYTWLTKAEKSYLSLYGYRTVSTAWDGGTWIMWGKS
jgi:hypothetical protein